MTNENVPLFEIQIGFFFDTFLGGHFTNQVVFAFPFEFARKICISNVNQSFFTGFIEIDINQMFIIMSGVIG